MRKMLFALSAIAAVAVASPASAQGVHPAVRYVAPVAGAAAGTTVALGLYNGWWTNSAGLPATAAGAAATGGLAAIGTVALIHAATTPCQGFQAFFGGLIPNDCAMPAPARVRHVAVRHLRRHR
jgi:hypothetical protein